MTIALGIIASDGIVVAADREITQGEAKGDQGKIMWNSSLVRGEPDEACIVSGAGRLGYLNSVGQSLVRSFTENAKTIASRDDAKALFENTLQQFHVDHVMPYSDNPTVETLIAYQRGNHLGMWTSDRGAMTEHFYAAVGAGAMSAIAVLQQVYSVRRLDVGSAIALAVYVAYHVKERVSGCGKFTDVVYIHDGCAQPVPTETIEDIEAAYRAYAKSSGRDVLRYLFGMDVDGGLPLGAIDATRGEISRLISDVVRQPG